MQHYIISSDVTYPCLEQTFSIQKSINCEIHLHITQVVHIKAFSLAEGGGEMKQREMGVLLVFAAVGLQKPECTTEVSQTRANHYSLGIGLAKG